MSLVSSRAVEQSSSRILRQRVFVCDAPVQHAVRASSSNAAGRFSLAFHYWQTECGEIPAPAVGDRRS